MLRALVLAGLVAGALGGLECTGKPSTVPPELSGHSLTADGQLWTWSDGATRRVCVTNVKMAQNGTLQGTTCTVAFTDLPFPSSISADGSTLAWADSQGKVCALKVGSLKNNTDQGVVCSAKVGFNLNHVSIDSKGATFGWAEYDEQKICLATVSQLSAGTLNGISCTSPLPGTSPVHFHLSANGATMVWVDSLWADEKVCILQSKNLVNNSLGGVVCTGSIGYGPDSSSVSGDGETFVWTNNHYAPPYYVTEHVCSAKVSEMQSGTVEGVTCTGDAPEGTAPASASISADGKVFVWADTDIEQAYEDRVCVSTVDEMAPKLMNGTICTSRRMLQYSPAYTTMASKGNKFVFSVRDTKQICLGTVTMMRENTMNGISCVPVPAAPKETAISMDGSVWLAKVGDGFCVGGTGV